MDVGAKTGLKLQAHSCDKQVCFTVWSSFSTHIHTPGVTPDQHAVNGNVLWAKRSYQSLSGRKPLNIQVSCLTGLKWHFSLDRFTKKTRRVSTFHSFPSGVNRKKVWVEGALRQNLNACRQGRLRLWRGRSRRWWGERGSDTQQFCQIINDTTLNDPPLLKEILELFFTLLHGLPHLDRANARCIPFFSLLSPPSQ